MNAINRFRIAPQLYTLEEIKRYYDLNSQSIECEYSSVDNRNYAVRFFGRSVNDVIREKQAVTRELSYVCSMCVMAYIESLFRIDSYIRVKHRYKGQLTGRIKTLLQDKDSIPRLRFETLLDAWEEEYADEKDLFRDINRSFKFRHWIAHGRYWKLDDNIDKHFDFPTIFMLAQHTKEKLGDKMYTQETIGVQPHKLTS